MRAVRSTLSFLAIAVVLAGCNGGDANVPTNATSNASTNTSNGANANAPDSNVAANGTDEHAGHDHAPGEHGASNAAPAAPVGDKVAITTTKPGTGVGAKDGDLLAMRYTGRLTNGKQFDSNVGKAPLNLILGAGSVIAGWEEGLQGVKIGEKRTLRIPAAKGYGAQGMGEDIPPNSDLEFDIECLYVVPAEKDKTVTREELKAGTGATIKEKQTVTFQFRGKLVDGTEFDSSYKAGKPATAKLGSGSLQPVGLEAAMVGMRVGGKYRLAFPPAVGFGPGAAAQVPPNSVVIFEIEPLSAK